MIEKIYIARHGYRLNWVTTTWKSPTGLPRDPPLASFGETQAEELGQYFLSLPETERPTAIFSSPYYRCLQTANPVAKALNLPIFVEHGIAEWYSPVRPGTGLHPRPGPPSSLQSFFPLIDPSWSSIYYPSRLGEEVTQVHDRASTFLDTFIPTAERLLPPVNHARILLVTHAATAITLVRALEKNVHRPLRVGCCSISELVWRGGRWDALRLADGSHLEQGSSRDWGFEDIEIDHGKVVEDPGVPGTENDSVEEQGPVGVQAPRYISSSL